MREFIFAGKHKTTPISRVPNRPVFAKFPSGEQGPIQQILRPSQDQPKLGFGQRNDQYKQAVANRTGIPDPLKTGLEQLSGMDLSSVRVHANSSKPARKNALAYTQGQDIHLGPGQEKHLPHEGWHAVQQMQGRVKPTMQAKGVSFNDNVNLEREADQMGSKATRPDQTSESGPKKLSLGKTSGESVAQRKLKLTGLTAAEQKEFVTKMNDGSTMEFELDASGFVQQKYMPAIATDEYSTQMVAAITDAQTVKLNLVTQDDAVFGDSFASGKVDYVDMVGMSARLFRSNLMHFVVERFAISNYEANKATASRADFLKAHKKGQEAQERQMKEWYPTKTIKYIGQGFDAASKVVDAAGNGSIDYYFDFTDVKQVFKQNVVAGATKESIISSRIEIVR